MCIRDRDGGGIYCLFSNPSISDVIITGNTAVYGGAMKLANCSPLIKNSLISNNIATTRGGGVYSCCNSNYIPIFENITFYGNVAGDDCCTGGAIWHGDSDVIIINSIFWDNLPQAIYAQQGYHYISYSNIAESITTSGQCYNCINNIDANPLFCNPDSGDYTLAENSPCVGTGDNCATMGVFGVGCEAILSTDKDIIPLQFVLHQNYPNPFNPVTTLRFDLPEDALVNITIYDMMGGQVKTLINDQQTTGYRSIYWNATNDAGSPVSAGIYLYMIQAGEFRQTRKMVLLK